MDDFRANAVQNSVVSFVKKIVNKDDGSPSHLQHRSHHHSRLRANSRHSVAAGLFSRHPSFSAASSRYSSPSQSSPSSFRRASKVAEGIGHGVIAGTSVVASTAAASSAALGAASSSTSLINFKSLKEKVAQGISSTFKSEPRVPSPPLSRSGTGVAQAMAASAVAAVAATAAASSKESRTRRHSSYSSYNNKTSSSSSSQANHSNSPVEKTRLSSQSSLTNEQLTAHLTEEERNILEKVFLKEEEFHRQELAGGQVFKGTSLNINKQLRRLSTRGLGGELIGLQENVSPLESPSSAASCSSGMTSAINTTTSSPLLLGCCRVCRKTIEPNEKYSFCDTCSQPVCEDCSSYSNVGEAEVWMCNVCRRRRSNFAVGDVQTGSGLQEQTVSSLQIRRLSSLRRTSATEILSGSSGSAPGSRNESRTESRNESPLFYPCESPGGRRRSQNQIQQQFGDDMMVINRPSTASPTLASQQQYHQHQNQFHRYSADSLEEQHFGDNEMSRRDSMESSESTSPNRPWMSRQKRSLPSEERSASMDYSCQPPQHVHQTVFQEYLPQHHSMMTPTCNLPPLPPNVYGNRQQYYQGQPQQHPRSLLNIEQMGASSSVGPAPTSPGLRLISSDASIMTHFDFSNNNGAAQVGMSHSCNVSPTGSQIHGGRRTSDSPISEYSSTPTDMLRMRGGSVSGLVCNAASTVNTPGDRESMSPCSPDYIRSPRQSGDSDRLSVNLPCMGQPSTQRRSIPSVLVDPAADLNYLSLKEAFPRRSSTGRVLPQIPIEQSRSLLDLPAKTNGSTHSLDLPSHQPRRASAPEGENIRIVIDDVDSMASKGYRSRDSTTRIERVILHRDSFDRSPRTRGFGLVVTGGKVNDFDGMLYTYVSGVAHSSPADKMGLKPGDKILEWDGKCLINTTFEQVQEIMDSSGNSAELIIEPLNRDIIMMMTG